jgi:hypothetical protein
MPATNRLCWRHCISRITGWPGAGCGYGTGAYLGDFLARAGADWHHSEWDFRRVIAAGPAKVHLDVQFTRYRIDNSVIGSFRSLWIVTERGGRWAVAARSSFAD